MGKFDSGNNRRLFMFDSALGIGDKDDLARTMVIRYLVCTNGDLLGDEEVQTGAEEMSNVEISLCVLAVGGIIICFILIVICLELQELRQERKKDG